MIKFCTNCNDRFETEISDLKVCHKCIRELNEFVDKLEYADCFESMKKDESTWPPELQAKIYAQELEGKKLLETVEKIQNKWLNNKKPSNDNLSAICLSADDIINLFEQRGFTSETPVDIEEMRHLIVEIIQNRLNKNVVFDNFIDDIAIDVEFTETPTDIVKEAVEEYDKNFRRSDYTTD